MLKLECSIFPEYKKFYMGGVFFIFRAWPEKCARQQHIILLEGFQHEMFNLLWLSLVLGLSQLVVYNGATQDTF